MYHIGWMRGRTRRSVHALLGDEMRDLRSRIEAVLQDYRDEAANEERFVSEVLTALAMGSVARGRMLAEMAQVVARHAAGSRSSGDEREVRRSIEELARFDYDTAYKQ